MRERWSVPFQKIWRMQLVVPSAVAMAVRMLMRICTTHLMVSFFMMTYA